MLTQDQVAAINDAIAMGSVPLIDFIVAARDALPSFEERLQYWADAKHYIGL